MSHRTPCSSRRISTGISSSMQGSGTVMSSATREPRSGPSFPSSTTRVPGQKRLASIVRHENNGRAGFRPQCGMRLCMSAACPDPAR